MLSFDVAELRREGVALEILPDERGRIVDVRTLPQTFTERLHRSGLDISKPLRIVGIIERRPNGAPGPYSIRFEQA